MDPLYNPGDGQMRVVGFMSGSGTNLVKILEFERTLGADPPYKIVGIFTNNPNSNAEKIAEEFGIPYFFNDFRTFCESTEVRDFCETQRIRPHKSMEIRERFDRKTLDLIAPLEATVAAYGGYMLIASPLLVKSILGVNVHPADLFITNEEGQRKYRGDHAVRDAILAGEKYLRSSTHIIEEEVDGGRILMVSDPINIQLPRTFDKEDEILVSQVADAHQELLKINGDWVIFPQTLLYMAEGRFARGQNGILCFDGTPIPKGVRLR